MNHKILLPKGWIMSAWDAYPATYRAAEIRTILSALRAGECVALVGLSGAGKSNLLGFLAYRAPVDRPAFLMVDGNRAQPRTAAGLFRLARLSTGEVPVTGVGTVLDEINALDQAIRQTLPRLPGGLCLLIDRFDALSAEEQSVAAGPLRALRDAYKYQLTFLTATRRPIAPTSELSELFFANTLWLGPLCREDALWSAGQYAERHGQQWDASVTGRLVDLSWGYPSLLRACCEAYALGAVLTIPAMRDHPAIQQRVQEFWLDQPSTGDLRRSGLEGHPLLSASQPVVDAEAANLTASEHRLLAYFQAHMDQVCAKDDLIRAVWPEDRVVDGLRDDSLAQLIRRLRQKIELDPAHPVHILTVPGRGYRYQQVPGKTG